MLKEIRKMKAYNFDLSRLTLMLLDLNHIIDKNLHIKCSYDEMSNHMEHGTVLDYLLKLYPTELFCVKSFNRDDETNFRTYFNTALNVINNVTDSNRKCGVERNGITLLIAYIIELIQQGKGKWKANTDIAGLD